MNEYLDDLAITDTVQDVTLFFPQPVTEEISTAESLGEAETRGEKLHTLPVPLGEGKGTPPQCSCLENPMDGEV